MKINRIFLGLVFSLFVFLTFNSNAEWSFKKLYKFNSISNGVAVNDDASVGYAVTYDGDCYEFLNGKLVKSIHITEGICQDVALASKANEKNIWVIDSDDNLQIGTIKDGNFQFDKVYKFKSQPNAIGLSSDGSIGFIAEEDGSIDEFINSKFSKVIKKMNLPCTGMVTSADGRKIWFLTARDELYQGINSDKTGWKFVMIYKFNTSPSDIAISSDGSIGYAVGSTGFIYNFKDGYFVGTDSYRIPDGAVAITTTADGSKIWITAGDFSLIEGVNK